MGALVDRTDGFRGCKLASALLGVFLGEACAKALSSPLGLGESRRIKGDGRRSLLVFDALALGEGLSRCGA